MTASSDLTLTVSKFISGTLDLGPGSVEELRGRIQGQVLLPGDAGYDEARTVWNAAIVVICVGVLVVKWRMDAAKFVAVSLLMSLLWLAAIGFVFYLVLKLISPDTARRVRETIKGSNQSKAA